VVCDERRNGPSIADFSLCGQRRSRKISSWKSPPVTLVHGSGVSLASAGAANVRSASLTGIEEISLLFIPLRIDCGHQQHQLGRQFLRRFIFRL
jgi:hypothetical protein